MGDIFGAIFLGICIGSLTVIMIFTINQPEIETEELYRFCLVKKIALEECIIPSRPYEKEQEWRTP